MRNTFNACSVAFSTDDAQCLQRTSLTPLGRALGSSKHSTCSCPWGQPCCQILNSGCAPWSPPLPDACGRNLPRNTLNVGHQIQPIANKEFFRETNPPRHGNSGDLAHLWGGSHFFGGPLFGKSHSLWGVSQLSWGGGGGFPTLLGVHSRVGVHSSPFVDAS